MKFKDIKTYVLLENGKIKNSYFDQEKTEMREFEHKGKGIIYMNYDEITPNRFARHSSKVIATSDSITELINILKEKDNDK